MIPSKISRIDYRIEAITITPFELGALEEEPVQESKEPPSDARMKGFLSPLHRFETPSELRRNMGSVSSMVKLALGEDAEDILELLPCQRVFEHLRQAGGGLDVEPNQTHGGSADTR
ncbi:MAG TPA: hypothetical protein VNW30_04830 [Opitutaceae bacterium]|nr:hypothetical protein [Opitutaceae bacterium]